MVKIVFAPVPKEFCKALERFYEHDFVSVIKHDLGPAKPHFRFLVRNVLFH